MHDNHFLAKIVKFTFTGAVGTVLHYVVLYTLVATTVASPTIAAMVGAASGALLNYYGNRKYTFASKQPHMVALPKYVFLSIVGIVISGSVVAAALAFSWHYLTGQLLATCISFAFNFVISSHLIFKR